MNRRLLLWRHAPGSLDLFVRKPLVQLAWPPSEIGGDRRLSGLHADEYAQVPLVKRDDGETAIAG